LVGAWQRTWRSATPPSGATLHRFLDAWGSWGLGPLDCVQVGGPRLGDDRLETTGVVEASPVAGELVLVAPVGDGAAIVGSPPMACGSSSPPSPTTKVLVGGGVAVLREADFYRTSTLSGPPLKFLRETRSGLRGSVRPGRGVVWVEPADAVEGVFGGAGEAAGGQDGLLVAVAAGEPAGQAPVVG
jgi:hypothetical protein